MEDDDSIAGLYAGLRKRSQERRADNRARAAATLKEAGIEFESRNGGAHLIVRGQGILFDYWPGTGLWKRRPNGVAHRGIRSLLQQIRPVAK